MEKGKKRVEGSERDFPKYVVAYIFQLTLIISIGAIFWLGIGKGIYVAYSNYVEKNQMINHENGEWDSYDDSGNYDSYDVEENNSGVHHVDRHWVDGYIRSDGAEVEGYWRGGEKGYERSNPDNSLDNNIGDFLK